MFTPSEIEGAFRRLFGLYNGEKVRQLKSAFKEELEGISLELLAWKYTNSAFQPLGYCEMERVGEPAQWHGLPILGQQAAFVAEALDTSYTSENFNVNQSIELWLLEDMTFAAVRCTEIFRVEGETFLSGIECRNFLTFVEESTDILISEETLIYALEDTCTFAQAAQDAEAMQ